MTKDDHRRLDANVDYGNVLGYFVRVDVELPHETLAGMLDGPDDAGLFGSLTLSPDRAESFAAELAEMAKRARAAEDGRRAGRVQDPEHVRNDQAQEPRDSRRMSW